MPDIFGGTRRQVEFLEAMAESLRFELEAAYLTLTSNVVTAAVQEASLRGQIAATARRTAPMCRRTGRVILSACPDRWAAAGRANSPDSAHGAVPNHTLNGVPDWACRVTDWLKLGACLPL